VTEKARHMLKNQYNLLQSPKMVPESKCNLCSTSVSWTHNILLWLKNDNDFCFYTCSHFKTSTPINSARVTRR